MAYNSYPALSDFIAICTHLLLRFLLSDRYGNLFKKAVMFFLIIFQEAYLHIPCVKHHHHFYILFGNTKLISRRFCHLGWQQPPVFFTSCTKSILFHCRCRGFCVIYLDDILVLTHSKHPGKRAWIYFRLSICSSWFTC